MTNMQNEESPASFREKWQFLRRTPILFTAWGLFALATALIGWGSLFAHLKDEQYRVEKLALLESQALARSHADRLMRSINAVDQVARHVRSDWQYLRRSSRLERMVQEGVFPQYSRYFVTLVDRHGMPFASTYPHPIFTFFSDRPYFRVQQNAKVDRLYVGDPLLSRISGMNVVNLSRKLVDADGAFDGIVLVSVAIDSFTVDCPESDRHSWPMIGLPRVR